MTNKEASMWSVRRRSRGFRALPARAWSDERAARVTPAAIVLGQAAITLLCTLAWCLGSWLAGAGAVGHAALSALAGGAACVAPSAWFARWLTQRGGSASVAGLVVGQAIKVLGIVALLAVVAVNFEGLRWLPWLSTLILTLKMHWAALALR